MSSRSKSTQRMHFRSLLIPENAFPWKLEEKNSSNRISLPRYYKDTVCVMFCPQLWNYLTWQTLEYDKYMLSAPISSKSQRKQEIYKKRRFVELFGEKIPPCLALKSGQEDQKVKNLFLFFGTWYHVMVAWRAPCHNMISFCVLLEFWGVEVGDNQYMKRYTSFKNT